MLKRFASVLLILAVFTGRAAFAIFDDYNHPELNWRMFETKNFIIFYSDGLEDVATLGAKVAEEIHEPLCELYQYRPDTKVSLIFSDNDDIANAASYFQSNKIHFYSTSMAWDFRGTHNWLRNVVTHEYTHMIQLGASRKWSRNIPAIYGQLLGYEPERRPDVLYGYPNRLISWPLPSVTVPAWLAEGTAQFQFTGNGYDFWDSHRDMLLRQAVLSNRLLSFEELGYFGKTSLQSEEIYNNGFSLVKYIADHSESPDVLRRISKSLSNPLPVTVDRAIYRATGKRGIEWYNEWKADLQRKYQAQRDNLLPTLTAADTLPVTGYVNLYPRLSPDGKKVAFISNQNRDYFGQSSLYIYDFETGESELVAPQVQGALTWLNDGRGIIFSRRGVIKKVGSIQYDLFVYTFDNKKTIRLSEGLRAESVDMSPDGQQLVFTINGAGRRDIAIAAMPDFTKSKFAKITPDNLQYRIESLPHEQYYLPRWSPDGKRIAVAHHRDDGRGIRIFSLSDADSQWSVVQDISGDFLELRDPSWSADGAGLYVAWDVSGISNIYRLDLESGRKVQLTSVLGGAFYPDFRTDRLVYTDYCENGFRICTLTDPPEVRVPANAFDATTDEQPSYAARVPRGSFDFSVDYPKTSGYKPVFEKLYWFPRIAFDYGTFKPGTYVLINDVLEKLTFIGGFAINQKRDYDLFGSIEYREFFPTIFADYYNIQRRLTSHFEDTQRIIGEEGEGPNARPIYDQYRIRFRYSLHEVDLGLKIPFGEGTHISLSGIYDSYNAHNRFDDESSIGITYFKGWAGKVGFHTDMRRPGVVSAINPSGGYKAYFEYTRANHLFYTDLEVGGDAVGLSEVYAPYNYDMMEGGVEKYLSLPGWDHTLELRGRGGGVTRTVDPFFYLYAGGLPGMRGYSYYSMGGEQMAIATVTYRFPIVRRAAWNLWPLSVNRIYGSVFSDVGNAWRGELEGDALKKDVGAGIRVQMHSFYSYPTALAFDVAYGFDRFNVVEEERATEYGQELRYYLTVLFSFYSPFSEDR